VSIPHLYLTWQAQCHLAERFAWDDERELGGALFGRADGRSIVIEEAWPNPHGADEPNRTVFDWDYFCRRIQNDQRRLIGNIHSHPATVGRPARASDVDLDGWASGSRGYGTFCGIVVTPAGERWAGGFPDSLDWSSPILAAWVAVDGGDVWSTQIVPEEKWLADLEATVRFRSKENTHGT
jgi:hypothetical protein